MGKSPIHSGGKIGVFPVFSPAHHPAAGGPPCGSGADPARAGTVCLGRATVMEVDFAGCKVRVDLSREGRGQIGTGRVKDSWA
ncbi:MAG: hypothetical protein JWL81_2018 [Verrucomicrobiales bacterium]|nr:hypothetical protein [Verrucomicrobiales bacterium]